MTVKNYKRKSKKFRKQLIQVLGGAYDLLSDKKRWVKRKLFTRKRGDDSILNGTKWCMVGALSYQAQKMVKNGEVDSDRAAELYQAAENIVLEKLREDEPSLWSIPTFNDRSTTSHEDVVLNMKKSYVDALDELLPEEAQR